jgi:GTPase SAR1 family protein
MGGCMGKDGPQEPNVPIQPEAEEYKLLLLGAGESGKSTLFKQMKIIHNNGYSQKDRESYKDIVRSNVLQAGKALVNASVNLNVPVELEANKATAQKLMSLDPDQFVNLGSFYNETLGQEIAALWADPGIQKTFEQRNRFQLSDSCEFFMNDLKRISADDYVPSEQDILRCRVKTTGIVETEFDLGGKKFKLLDVGGQRTERKKWIHYFDNVTAVLFIVSLNEYDQKLYEDDATPRMKESLILFDEICNSKYFTNTQIILIFNKDDLFRTKIKRVDLKVFDPKYEGGCDYDKAIAHIKKEFLDKRQDLDKKIVTYVTCATDTSAVQKAFEEVRDLVVSKK